MSLARFRDRWQGDDDAGRTVAQGVYVVRLVAPDASGARKMVITH